MIVFSAGAVVSIEQILELCRTGNALFVKLCAFTSDASANACASTSTSASLRTDSWRRRKIFSASAKQKNSESEAIGSWRERKNTSASATKKNSESEAIGAGQETTQAQTQYFLFHLESGLGAGIITRASTSSRIKIFPFYCGCAYACVCAATSEN